MDDKKDDLNFEFDFVSWRGISRKTMESTETFAKLVNGVIYEIGFQYGPEATKVRKPDRENGRLSARCVGEFQKAGLFLQDRFDAGSKPSITIFEGEPDALSGIELLRNQTACVSLKSGAQSAYTDLSRQDIYDYVNSFEKIYICFDADQPGQDAVKSIQGLFDFRKTYVVKLGKFKDANEYLVHGAGDDFYETWKNAKRYAPDNIISSFVDIEKALEESKEDLLGEYPFVELNKRLYGGHAGEVTVVKAPEGVGKTEFCRALEYHLLKTTDHPIAIIHLEEDNGTTIKAIAGYELEVPAVLPDCGLSRSDILNAYKRAVRDDEGRIHIYASFDFEDEKAFLGNFRFLAAAFGCRIFVLDHITWLATGLNDDDERKKLDRISQKLKLLAKELRFWLIEISHVNDDGKTRGSRNISKVANTVISLERDLVGGSNVTKMVVEKARLGGRTGPAGFAYFDEKKGMLLDKKPEEILKNV